MICSDVDYLLLDVLLSHLFLSCICLFCCFLLCLVGEKRKIAVAD